MISDTEWEKLGGLLSTIQSLKVLYNTYNISSLNRKLYLPRELLERITDTYNIGYLEIDGFIIEPLD